MKVLVLGADGYLGWPTSLMFAQKGCEVCCVDNYVKRQLCEEISVKPLVHFQKLEERVKYVDRHYGLKLDAKNIDLRNFDIFKSLLESVRPDVIVHYAEQPSAPYSMIGAAEGRFTLVNNLEVTFNLIQALIQTSLDSHLIKLGTMGEYGTPNIDIEEGWLEVRHEGRSDTFLYPRQASSLYHTTKIMDTDLLWFYARTNELRVSDLMQGPVYGLKHDFNYDDPMLDTQLFYDGIMGTVINRFAVQLIAGVPLSVYGTGMQSRGYLNVNDTLKCIDLVSQTPPKKGSLEIYNQFTETFSVGEIAQKIIVAGEALGLKGKVEKIKNPRKESEKHYYNPKNDKLLNLGLKVTKFDHSFLTKFLGYIHENKEKIDVGIIDKRISWT